MIVKVECKGIQNVDDNVNDEDAIFVNQDGKDDVAEDVADIDLVFDDAEVKGIVDVVSDNVDEDDGVDDKDDGPDGELLIDKVVDDVMSDVNDVDVGD